MKRDDACVRSTWSGHPGSLQPARQGASGLADDSRRVRENVAAVRATPHRRRRPGSGSRQARKIIRHLSGSALATPEPERSLAAESALLGLMSAVVRELRAAEHGAPRIVSVARDFVAGHLDEKLTIERIAQAAGVHPTHLARTFSSRTGETIGAFVRRLRAERAKQLLKSSSSPLSEVATRCGFSDQSHMGRILRGIYGLTPRQLRGRAGYRIRCGPRSSGEGSAAERARATRRALSRCSTRPTIRRGFAEAAASPHAAKRRPR